MDFAFVVAVPVSSMGATGERFGIQAILYMDGTCLHIRPRRFYRRELVKAILKKRFRSIVWGSGLAGYPRVVQLVAKAAANLCIGQKKNVHTIPVASTGSSRSIVTTALVFL